MLDAVGGASFKRSYRLLRPGGRVAVEHDDATADATAALFVGAGVFTDVVSRRDLAGRPRFVTAMRAG